MKKRNRWKVYVACLAMGSLFSCKKEIKEKPIDPVEVQVLQMGTVNQNTANTIGYSGTIAADKKVSLVFQVPGTLQQLNVAMGNFVQQGALIAAIDPTTYQNQYKAREAQASLAKQNYERINEVYQKGSIAEIRMLEAKSQFEQATAAATAAYQNVKHTKITAPFSGYIGSKMMEAGDVANPGMPVVQLLDIDKVKATVTIPSTEINHLKRGDTTTVQIDDLHNKQFTGVVTEVAIEANRMTPAYTAKITIANTDKVIKPGMACEVLIGDAASKNSAMVLPVNCVSVTESGENFVYVVNTQKQVAERRTVTVGQLYSNGIAITQGITANDLVITSGYHKLTNGTPVKVIP